MTGTHSEMVNHARCAGRKSLKRSPRNDRREVGKMSDEENSTARTIKLIKNQGIVEGLRMAANLAFNMPYTKRINAITISIISGAIRERILSKAKQIEESAK